ncbi:hypothetical protein [Streptomyces sp. NPDC001270]|uniref:hypothetical protein n=1 Tax=Streptomyces sp. NPDC001270 TaxID=3364554 RepID=UPI0036776817
MSADDFVSAMEQMDREITQAGDAAERAQTQWEEAWNREWQRSEQTQDPTQRADEQRALNRARDLFGVAEDTANQQMVRQSSRRLYAGQRAAAG